MKRRERKRKVGGRTKCEKDLAKMRQTKMVRTPVGKDGRWISYRVFREEWSVGRGVTYR